MTLAASACSRLKKVMVVTRATRACSKSLSSAILMRTNRRTPLAPATR